MRFKTVLKWWWVLLLPLLYYIAEKWISRYSGYSDTSDKIRTITALLYDAMNTYGTDEKTMLDLLKPLNRVELVRVYKEFGQKGYLFGGAMIGGLSLDLFGWFEKELNESEKETMREIWRKSGLSLTF